MESLLTIHKIKVKKAQYFEQKKRGFDLLFAVLALLLLAPVIPLIALLTKLSSHGPVLYKQERIGQFGSPFVLYKFRSMINNAEENGPALSSKSDPRVTSWGRFMRRYKLDEIPQFYNVLRGEMSIVGPRPERAFWQEKIEEQSRQFRLLHEVKPGMTSLGQVKFGYAENVEQMRQRLRYDLLYLNQASLRTDLRILWITLIVILRGPNSKGK